MSSDQPVGNRRLNRAGRIVYAILAGLIMLLALSLVLGFFVQLLWNATLAEIFEIPAISYWQGVGLFILARLLFGFGFRGGRRHWGHRGRKRHHHKYKKDSGEQQATENADESSG